MGATDDLFGAHLNKLKQRAESSKMLEISVAKDLPMNTTLLTTIVFVCFHTYLNL